VYSRHACTDCPDGPCYRWSGGSRKPRGRTGRHPPTGLTTAADTGAAVGRLGARSASAALIVVGAPMAADAGERLTGARLAEQLPDLRMVRLELLEFDWIELLARC